MSALTENTAKYHLAPGGTIDKQISDAHREIAEKFVEYITQKEALDIWRFFEADVHEMEKYFTGKFGSYYMIVGQRNIFISSWIISQVVEKAVPELKATE